MVEHEIHYQQARIGRKPEIHKMRHYRPAEGVAETVCGIEAKLKNVHGTIAKHDCAECLELTHKPKALRGPRRRLPEKAADSSQQAAGRNGERRADSSQPAADNDARTMGDVPGLGEGVQDEVANE